MLINKKYSDCKHKRTNSISCQLKVENQSHHHMTMPQHDHATRSMNAKSILLLVYKIRRITVKAKDEVSSDSLFFKAWYPGSGCGAMHQ